MLPAPNRMRRSTEFGAAVRSGRRSGRVTVVLHLAVVGEARDPARVGFVVSKAVGSAVVRNRVKRRLRALMRDRLAVLPRGALLVVRANPAAAGAPTDRVERDIDSALRGLGVAAAVRGV